ncbi:MAG: cytochrome c peroxidase [Hyphomicrobiaceae bacterium]
MSGLWHSRTIRDAARNRWFGWDGRSDSLWAHSIGPILDPAEIGADAGHVARTIRAAGAEVSHLAPYSPDLSPIETVYSKLKSESAFTPAPAP